MCFFNMGNNISDRSFRNSDISIYRVRKIYLLQKLFSPRKCLTVDISPVRLETLNTKMTIYSLSNVLSFDKCGFVKKNCRQKKNKRVDNMFQIVKIVVISGFTVPSFGHIKALSNFVHRLCLNTIVNWLLSSDPVTYQSVFNFTTSS